MIKNVEFKNEQDGITTFLSITVAKGAGMNMLHVQRLADGLSYGLIPCAIIPKVGEYVIRYNEVSKITLEEFVESGLTKDRLLHILKETIAVMEKVQEKGLSVENLVLDKKHIYLDSFSNTLLFIYVPIRNNSFEKVSMKEFVVDLMLSAPFDEKDDLYFYIKLQNYVARDREFTLTGLKEVLAEWDKELVIESQADVILVEAPTVAEAPVTADELPLKAENPPPVVKRQENPALQEPVQERIVQEAPPGWEESDGDRETVSAPTENKSVATENKEGFDAPAAATVTDSAPSDDISPNFYSPGQASIASEDERKPQTSSSRNNKLKNENVKKGPFKWFTSTKQDSEPVGNSDPHFSDTEDEGTTVLNQQDDGTTILCVKNEKAPMKPFLVAEASGKETVIDKDEFTIGRDPHRSHFVINNKVVGRLHARILTIGGEYFLEDVSSRNGTFVNSIKVKPGEKVKIKHDDKITLANEWFTFRVY